MTMEMWLKLMDLSFFVGRRGFKRKEEGEGSEIFISPAKPRMPG